MGKVIYGEDDENFGIENRIKNYLIERSLGNVEEELGGVLGVDGNTERLKSLTELKRELEFQIEQEEKKISRRSSMASSGGLDCGEDAGVGQILEESKIVRDREPMLGAGPSDRNFSKKERWLQYDISERSQDQQTQAEINIQPARKISENFLRIKPVSEQKSSRAREDFNALLIKKKEVSSRSIKSKIPSSRSIRGSKRDLRTGAGFINEKDLQPRKTLTNANSVTSFKLTTDEKTRRRAERQKEREQAEQNKLAERQQQKIDQQKERQKRAQEKELRKKERESSRIIETKIQMQSNDNSLSNFSNAPSKNQFGSNRQNIQMVKVNIYDQESSISQ